MQALHAVADKVGMGGVLDSVVDKAKEGLGAALKPQLEKAVNQILEQLGPKAGGIAFEKMKEKYSVLGKVAGAEETAVDAAAEAIMSFKQKIMDFCEDVMAEPKATLKKMGVVMLKACKEAADRAVRALMNKVQCAACFKMCVNLQSIIDNVTKVVQDALKEMFEATLKSNGVPSMVTDQMEWGNEDDEVEPAKKDGPPQQEEMS